AARMSVSTSTGRAARQGDQRRNIFSRNRTGRVKSTKMIFPKSHFCFRRRCAFALSKRSAFAQIHTPAIALIASAERESHCIFGRRQVRTPSLFHRSSSESVRIQLSIGKELRP